MAEDDKNYGLARAYYLKLSDRYRNYYYGVAARKRLATLPEAPAGRGCQPAAHSGHHQD